MKIVSFSSIRSILVCWLDTYEEDFFDPEAEFAMLTNLSDFATRSKLRELKDKARKLKEEFRRIVNDGGWIGENYWILYIFLNLKF